MEKTVTWSVTGGKSQTTTISADGTLAVADNETAESLTVKATSVIDHNKSGAAIVAVIQQTHADNLHPFRPHAEHVKVQYMGETIVCEKVDGRLFFQGDILVDPDEISTRSAEGLGVRRWNEGKIYYTMEDKDNTQYRTIVSTAMREISNSTNIKFVELKNSAALAYAASKCYLLFRTTAPEGDINGWSYYGMRSPAQEIMIIKIDKGTVVHELGHALGLMHEHSRSDRDNHITYRDSLIDRKRFGNKEPKEIDEFIKSNWGIFSMGEHTEFDFSSLMIYDPRAGGKVINGVQQQVLVRENGTTYLDIFLLTLIRSSFSPKDIENINKMYREQTVSPDFFIHQNYSDLTENSIKLTVEWIYKGYPALTQIGICFRERGTGAYTYHPIPASLVDDGTITYQLTGLKPNTLYEARAYAIQVGLNSTNRIESENKVEFTTQGSTNRYSVTASVSGGNGSIAPSGTQQYNQGSDVTFTITPNSGYEINSLLVNNVNRTGEVSGGKFTLRNITTNYTIIVSFRRGNLPTSYSSDFNNNVFDTNFWSKDLGGNNLNDIRVEDGMMKLEQNTTDLTTILVSRELLFNNVIVLERDVLLHAGGDYFYPTISFNFNNEKTLEIGYHKDKYEGGKYLSEFHDKICYKIYENGIWWQYVQTDIAAQTILGKWFHEKIVINRNDKFQYYLNNNFIGEYDIKNVANNANSYYLKINPYGWWTGHKQYFDNFSINSN